MADVWEHLRNVRRITPYAKPYRRLVVLLWLFTGLGAVVALFQPWPFAFVVDSIIGDKSFPGWLGWLGERAVWIQLSVGVFLTLMMTLLQHVITISAETVGTKLELNIVLEYRSDLFAHAQQLSLSYHDSQRKGAFIYQINFHAHSAGSVYTTIPPLVQAALTLVGMFLVTYHLDPAMAIVATLVAPLLFISVRYYAKYVQTELYRVRNLEGESMSIIHESMSIIWIVVSNVRQRHEHAKFREQAQTAITSRVRLTVMQTVFAMAVSLITALGTGLVIFFGAQSVISGQLTLGELLVVLAYVAAIYKPMEQISTTLGSLQETLINLGLSFDLLDTEIEVHDMPEAMDMKNAMGHIVFEDVSFGYPGRPNVLSNISFEIQPGERVAIVGPTGAGKSTLMSMLARFSDPAAGRILLDGHDLRELRVDDVRNSLAFVLQEPVMFKGSIMENIRYGRLDATDDDVIQAAKDAGAHEFVQRLPHGYATDVGERGALLSGGERQRLCVARAFVRDAPVLILDEPTSSIDSRTEQAVLEALDRLALTRTTLIIAHRLSTVRNADRILVIEDGRIVEVGTPDALLGAGGTYAALAVAQGMAPARSEPPAISAPQTPPAAATTVSSSTPSARPKIVVLGMLTRMPVAGAVWQVVHYLVGLERLGVDPYYVEAHACTPSMFCRGPLDTGSERAAAFLAHTMSSVGFEDRWAFHALHDDGSVYGMSAEALAGLYRDAALVINLHGGTHPLPEHAATGRLVYLETDPGQMAVELHEGRKETLEFLEPHTAFFTFAENWNGSDCTLPKTDRFDFVPTRQPVVLDLWQGFDRNPTGRFTTIGNWRQHWRTFTLDGDTYHWSKHLEFERFISLPKRVPATMELALASIEADERSLLEASGWHVRHALEVSAHPSRYRDYVCNSIGEFTVAKDQNVRLRTGWFSDRSCTYLAAGRPVVTQDTGFGAVLPLGEGLFACANVDEAAAAVEAIIRDEARHRRGAADVAREFFDHHVVLRPLLDACDVAVKKHRGTVTSPAAPPGEPRDIPQDTLRELVLQPRSRRPLVLDELTEEALLARAVPEAAVSSGRGSRRVSVVIVTHGNLALTKLCVESVLVNTNHPNLEVVIVDNASTDGTAEYLAGLERSSNPVQAIVNAENRGFAAAVNQGLSQSTGEVLVVMNNDVAVAPGWLHGLAGHLDDIDVGMVGPVTNAAPNEARVPTRYRTYGEFLDEAASRAVEHRRESTDVRVLTMFCVMFRRAVFSRIGMLDEGFGLGLFEDDDYAMRVRSAGLRLVCADDVLVHHFGEASFGALVPGGQHAQLFRVNQARFEVKWGPWQPHRHRQNAEHESMVARVRAVLSWAVPEGEAVAVAAKGEADWLRLNGRRAVQLPVGESGEFDGSYPADDAEAIASIASLRDDGVAYIAFPATSRWWLDHYSQLNDHIAANYEVIVDNEDLVVFRAREAVAAWN